MMEMRIKRVFNDTLSMEERKITDLAEYGTTEDLVICGHVLQVDIVIFSRIKGTDTYSVNHLPRKNDADYKQVIYLILDNLHFDALIPKGREEDLPGWRSL